MYQDCRTVRSSLPLGRLSLLRHFLLSWLGGRVLLASSEQWSGKLQNILLCSEQYYITKNYPAPNNNSVNVEKPCCRRSFEHSRIQKILYSCAHPEKFICRQILANQEIIWKILEEGLIVNI